ncbi:MAG TPA: ATP-dependent DNA ligase [Bauldia sp.]|nr:ATP-dependent DNA ligase [Bauldia sp.]
MKLPVNPPVLPMLAKRIDALPEGEGWFFEPKWDGFRAIVFRDGGELLIQSRDARPLDRYYPELVAALKAGLPERCVLDSEIVIVTDRGLDFDLLQMRLHPAESRVRKLAAETPASVVFFDLIADGRRDWRDAPFAERRAALEKMLGKPKPPLYLTPTTRDPARAGDWFARFEGAGFDGVMAKHESLTYQPNKRAMLKVKHEREADCVVAGFRWHKNGRDTEVGSLLLGLYDAAGALQHVGVCASFTAEKRRELVAFLRPYRVKDLTGHPWADWASLEEGDEPQRRPGAESRWSQGKDLSWVPLKPELVVEVVYDHMQAGRFRHTAQFRRWRKDKAPADCTFAQLEVVAPAELKAIFGKR